MIITFLFQNCTDVLTALKKGELGPCDTVTEEYTNKCHTLFPYTAIFRPPSSSTVAPSENNHIAPEQENCNSN